MDNTDKKRFCQIMLGVADNFRDVITRNGLDMRFNMLQEFTIEEVDQAARKIMRNRKFTKMPPISEFFEAIAGDPQDKALLAWIQVDKAVKSDGVYTSVKFSDTVIHSVINAMGGWVALGLCSMDEWKWKQKEFEKLYAIMSRQNEHPEHLPGQIELDNSALGYQKHIPDVKLIGPGVTKLPNSGRYLQ